MFAIPKIEPSPCILLDNPYYKHYTNDVWQGFELGRRHRDAHEFLHPQSGNT